MWVQCRPEDQNGATSHRRVVDRTVREHLDSLEQRRLSLTSKIMEEEDLHKRKEFETELRAVESAMTLYRAALETESRIQKND
jgi:hypothetical protein